MYLCDIIIPSREVDRELWWFVTLLNHINRTIWASSIVCIFDVIASNLMITFSVLNKVVIATI